MGRGNFGADLGQLTATLTKGLLTEAIQRHRAGLQDARSVAIGEGPRATVNRGDLRPEVSGWSAPRTRCLEGTAGVARTVRDVRSQGACVWAEPPSALMVATTCGYRPLVHSMIFDMSAGSDHDWRPYVRGAVVGLVIAASTFMADLATYMGPLDSSRLTSFGLAGGFAAAVALLLATDKKKSCYE